LAVGRPGTSIEETRPFEEDPLRTVPARLFPGYSKQTQGEIEAAVCEGVARFEQDYMGRGPKDIHAHLIGDLLVVRLQGVLTAAEQQLVKSLPAEKGTCSKKCGPS
jgi:hypothetical protein